MVATRLAMHRVEKPWGRKHLWQGFRDPEPDAGLVGEIWFQTPGGDPSAELLIKYLFTSEKLSVQVHPDDTQAHARGLRRGKDECWLILAAEPGAQIAIGTREPLTDEQLLAAAQDGTIERLLDWKPVEAGDIFYSPAGTIHAIGGGLTLIEVQQNSDATYRLYDYGRPRDLHPEDAVAVADAKPFVPHSMPGEIGEGRAILVDGPKFILERWAPGRREIRVPDGVSAWLIPVTGAGTADGVAFQAGDCLTITGKARIETAPGSDVLLAYPGTARLPVQIADRPIEAS